MTASLLPNGKQQFFNGNGKPLALGSVYFYVPNTSTLKHTWQDPGATILNTNPVILDASGEAVIYGNGNYRQVVYDALGNLIWDQLTSASGGSGGISETNVGFFSQIITPLVAPLPPVPDNLTISLSGGSAIVNSIPQLIPAIIRTFAINTVYDYWLNADGSWTIESQPIATYINLPLYKDKLHVWQVTTNATTVSVITLMGNTYPVVTRIDDHAVTIDTFNETFFLYDTTINWSAGLAVFYSQILVTAAGNVYQVQSNGTTGSVAPTANGTGPITDGTAILAYYSRSDFLGMFRESQGNGIEYYFANIGLAKVIHKTLVTGSPLSSPGGTQMSAQVKKYILASFRHLIGEWVGSSTYVRGMNIALDGYIWNSTSATGSTDATNAAFISSRPHSIGQTITDGTVTWLAINVNYASQLYFWFDCDRTFTNFTGPDATDSQAATFASLLAAYIQLTNDYNWLFTASPFPGKTYKDLFDSVIYYNLSTQLANFLTQTFQGNIYPGNGTAFSLQYLEDNCECYHGFGNAAYISYKLNDSTRGDLAIYNQGIVNSGINALYNGTYNLFAYYLGDDVSTWANDPTKNWYPWLQCQFFPELYNVTDVNDQMRKLVRNNVATRWPEWWQNKALASFPETGTGYMAAKIWQDTHKAYAAIEKYDRYYTAGDNPVVISDMAFYIAIKDALVPPYTPAKINGSQQSFLVPYGDIINVTSPIMIGGALINMANTTAVLVGQTPSNARFVPVDIIIHAESASAAVLGAANIDVGFTAAAYSDWLSSAPAAGFTDTNAIDRFSIAASGSPLSCAASTNIYAKMSTAITSGSLTARIYIIGFTLF